MDENQIYYLGRVEKNTIVLKQNSNLFSKTIIPASQYTTYSFEIPKHRFVFIYFCADGSYLTSYYLYAIPTYSKKDDEKNLMKILDGNQSLDGYKIKAVKYSEGVLTVTTSSFGGKLRVIAF